MVTREKLGNCSLRWFLTILFPINEFIHPKTKKKYTSKLNNQKISKKAMAEINFISLLWLEIPLQCVLIKTWTPKMWMSSTKRKKNVISLFFVLFLHSQTPPCLANDGCRGTRCGPFLQPGQWEEFHREYVWADQVPGVPAQGNQRCIRKCSFTSIHNLISFSQM